MWLDAALFEEAAFSPEDLIRVVIERPEENLFRVYISANGEPIMDLPPSTVRLQYAAQEEQLPLCVSENGVAEVLEYDSKLQLLTIKIKKTGEYRITRPHTAVREAFVPGEDDAPADIILSNGRPAGVRTSYLPVITGVTVVAGVGGAITYRRRRGR